MQSFGAHHAPHYTSQALRARGKRAVVLPHAFGLRSIVAGWTWCAISMASAAAARTATTAMHSPTHRRLRQRTTATTTMNSTTAHHTANVAATCATPAPSKRLRRNPLLKYHQSQLQEISWQEFWRSHAPRGASVRVCVCPSGKWLVGPSCTSNRATCLFISLGDSGRCYGVSMCRADALDQRRVRCWLPLCAFFVAILWCHG
jgi:hypothetical protein